MTSPQVVSTTRQPREAISCMSWVSAPKAGTMTTSSAVSVATVASCWPTGMLTMPISVSWRLTSGL